MKKKKNIQQIITKQYDYLAINFFSALVQDKKMRYLFVRVVHFKI